jgi:hypothetical protein
MSIIRGLMPAVAVWTPEDGVLGTIAPLGLAVAGGDCLMIDLDARGPAYPGSRTLADLVRDGPRRIDLSPDRRGVAVLPNGGIDADAAGPALRALIDGWDRVVVRLPPRPAPPPEAPVVAVRLLLPGQMCAPVPGRAVYQTTPLRVRLPGPGVRLPIPPRRTVAALLEGRLPVPGCRWIRTWRRVWEMTWTQ